MILRLALIGLLLTAETASAQFISVGAQQAAGPLVGFFTGGAGVIGFNQLAALLVQKAWMLVAAAATYLIVRAGIQLINGQEEDKLTKARRTIGASLVAVMAFYLGPRVLVAIYTAGGSLGVFETPAGVNAGATVFADEIYGIIRWVEVMVMPIAIGMIVVSGFKIMGSFGKEEALPTMRKSIAGVGAGLMLLLLDPIVKLTLGIPNLGMPGVPSTAPLLARAIAIVNTLLLYLALLGVIVAVYAGIRVLVSFGKEEELNQAKQLLGRAAIGLLVIFLSYGFSVFILSLLPA